MLWLLRWSIRMHSGLTHGWIYIYFSWFLSKQVSLVTALVQELNMVTNSTKLQSTGSKHTLMNIKWYHCKDQSTVKVIKTQMKGPAIKLQWPAPYRPQWPVSGTAQPIQAILLKTLMLPWCATIYSPIGSAWSKPPYTHCLPLWELLLPMQQGKTGNLLILLQWTLLHTITY